MENRKKATVDVDESHLKLIMGLKLKQLRTEKGFSLVELAARTGISISYLNEIEKGKKLPKADKIAVLANALEVSYDWLVSTKLNKKMAPVADILQSRIMKEILLDIFGIDKTQLLELLARVPVKLNAFLNTLIEISRNYGMSVENFYFSALRSYQEMHENYFEEIEREAADFARLHHIVDTAVSPERLKELLMSKYHYVVEEDGLANQPELQELRSVTLPGKSPRLLLNRALDRHQKAFILAKELGFQQLKITDRPYTSTWMEFDSFEQVLNNFKASYFAGALMISQERAVAGLQQAFSESSFRPEILVSLMEEFSVSPETFARRITNLLPRFFGIQEIFFLRFSNRVGTDSFELTKEMHLAGLHNPHTNMMQEHYCRRWVSINILRDLSNRLKKGVYDGPICQAQRSRALKAEEAVEEA